MRLLRRAPRPRSTPWGPAPKDRASRALAQTRPGTEQAEGTRHTVRRCAGRRQGRPGDAEPGAEAARSNAPSAADVVGSQQICPLAFPFPAVCEAMHREGFACVRPVEEWKEALEVCSTQHTLYLDKLDGLASELRSRPTADGRSAELAEKWRVAERGNEHTDFPAHRARLSAAVQVVAEDRTAPFPSDVRAQLEHDLRTERQIIAGLCCFRAAQRRARAASGAASETGNYDRRSG